MWRVSTPFTVVYTQCTLIDDDGISRVNACPEITQLMDDGIASLVELMMILSPSLRKPTDFSLSECFSDTQTHGSQRKHNVLRSLLLACRYQLRKGGSCDALQLKTPEVAPVVLGYN